MLVCFFGAAAAAPKNLFLQAQCSREAHFCDGMRHIAIMNALGQVIYEAEPADARSAQVNLSGFDAGVYIVRITTDNGMISKSVVKAEF